MNSANITKSSVQLEDVLFGVELQTLYAEVKQPDKLFTKQMPVPNHFGVINQKSGQVLSVVGKDYRLISNQNALDIGKQLFRQLYPSVKPEELIPFKVIAPASKASVHIDLIHPNVNFKVFKQETWLPFLRVSNSYNRVLALTFEIGFVRALCSNGVLFEKDSLKLKYYHSKNSKLDHIRDAGQIQSASNDFIQKCHQLETSTISPEMMIPLVFKALNINMTINDNGQIIRKLIQLDRLLQTTRKLIRKYINEMGKTYYAAFNVMTDLVSHEDVHKCLPGFQLQVRSYYSKPSVWVDFFIKMQSQPDFSIDKYLNETILELNQLEQDTGIEWRLN